MEPLRIEITGEPAVPLETFASQAQACSRERAPRREPHGRKLAVCGGGPLLVNDLEELRAWDGDVWGINYTARWLNEQGIPASLFTIDPKSFHDEEARLYSDQDVAAVPHAVIASSCHPDLFEALRNAAVEVFDIAIATEKGLPTGASSATSTPWIALHFGYRSISIFGCEGSFETTDHVDRDEQYGDHVLIVRASGRDYKIRPPMLVQCLEFARIFREVGDVFTNRSHGLLEAIIADPNGWSVVAVSAAMREHLKDHNGHTIYNVPYEGISP